MNLIGSEILFSYTEKESVDLKKYDESYLSGLLKDQKKKETKKDELKINLAPLKNNQQLQL